jgi:hypothetical protein
MVLLTPLLNASGLLAALCSSLQHPQLYGKKDLVYGQEKPQPGMPRQSWQDRSRE